MSKINKHLEKILSVFNKIFLTLVIVLTLSTLAIAFFPFDMKMFQNGDVGKMIMPVANAKEIYPEFVCGCCGTPLNTEKICCGMAQNMIDFIGREVAKNISEDEVVFNTVREFGFNSLAKEETKIALKTKLAENAPADAPKIVLENKSYDFGDVGQKDGIVSTVFDFKNEGKSDLVIDKISTSCGCTSASIVYKDVEGPSFTMPGHGKENPTDWSISIAPGDTAQVKVYYDPNAHGIQKEKELSITRTVDIFSNDPVEFEKQIRIDLNQLP